MVTFFSVSDQSRKRLNNHSGKFDRITRDSSTADDERWGCGHRHATPRRTAPHQSNLGTGEEGYCFVFSWLESVRREGGGGASEVGSA